VSSSNDRVARLLPAELDGAQRALYDVITGGPRARGAQHFALTDAAGGLVGPFNAMLLSPAVGGPLQALGAALRYSSGLDDETREIAVLVVAQVWDSAFERHAHEAIARAAGLGEPVLAAVREGRFADLPTASQRLVAATTAALAGPGDLDDEQYAAACDLLGADGLFELMTLVGYYATLALQLRVLRIT
jgi:4-carboxymuconolactone decarboxylase